MLNLILGIFFTIAMPQVLGALAAQRLHWRRAAVWAWPLLAAADSTVTWHVHDRIEAARAAAADHFVCGSRVEAIVILAALHAVVGTVLALGTRLMLGPSQAARG